MFSSVQELAWGSTVLRKWLALKSPADDFESDKALPESPPSPPSSTLFSATAFKDGLSEDSTTPASEIMLGGEQLAPWMRISGFKEELRKVWDKFVDKEEIKIVAATWNLAGVPPSTDFDLDEWLCVHDEPPADIYVIGLQEIVPLTANSIFNNMDVEQRGKQWDEVLRNALNKEDSAFVSLPLSPSRSYSENIEQASLNNDILSSGKINSDGIFVGTPSGLINDRTSFGLDSIDSGDSVVVSRLDFPPDDVIEEVALKPQLTESASRALSSDAELLGVSPGGSFRLKSPRRYLIVASKQMVGIHLVVWVRAPLLKFVKNVKISRVGVGPMGLGNKGSVAVSMTLHETTFCFVNSHLTAGERDADAQKRILDLQEVLRRTQFSWEESRDDMQQLRKFPETIQEHEQVIWVGDFNFRFDLDLPDEAVRKLIAKEDWKSLADSDTLRKELAPGRVLSSWKEGILEFAPTYKYVIGSGKYIGDEGEDGEKRRTPAWCDRVIWLGNELQLNQYKRSEITFSDHRPVTAVITAEVSKISPSRQKEALEHARREVDKRAQRSLPSCDVTPDNVNFEDVKYGREVVRSIELQNHRQVTAHFSIESGKWVSTSTTKGSLEPGEVLTLNISALVLSPETDIETELENGYELMETVIINVEGGGSRFLPCSARYLPSCWGLSLSTLSTISCPIREISAIPRQTQDQQLVGNGVTAIPKEVQRMVTYLLEVGIEAANAFDATLVGIDPNDWDSPPNQVQYTNLQGQASFPGNSEVSWEGNRLQLEGKVALLREALDTGEAFPVSTTPQLVGTALVLFLRALPKPIISTEVTELIDSPEGSLPPIGVLEKLEGLSLSMLDALLELFQALLRNRIGNHFAIREVAAVFSSSLFPQTGSVDRKLFGGRVKFLQKLIDERLDSENRF